MARALTIASVKLLNDGNRIPVLGLGTWLDSGQAVSLGLKHGYRLFDTASLYENEEGVSKSIKSSGIPREDIFVVTKVWDTDHGKERTKQSFSNSLKRLDLDYIDLYLMHSAIGGKTVETWDAMIELKEKGLIRSIGVSNFNAHHLRELKKARPNYLPSVNQIEIHPFLAWDECVSVCQEEDIAVMAYSPLAKAMKIEDPTLTRIAKKYKKTPAQIMIRWSLQHGFVCIPKTSKEQRMVENADVFDFHITEQDIQTLTELDEHFISDWPIAMTHPWEP